jgi:hypothetical protein
VVPGARYALGGSGSRNFARRGFARSGRGRVVRQKGCARRLSEVIRYYANESDGRIAIATLDRTALIAAAAGP